MITREHDQRLLGEAGRRQHSLGRATLKKTVAARGRTMNAAILRSREQDGETERLPFRFRPLGPKTAAAVRL